MPTRKLCRPKQLTHQWTCPLYGLQTNGSGPLTFGPIVLYAVLDSSGDQINALKQMLSSVRLRPRPT